MPIDPSDFQDVFGQTWVKEQSRPVLELGKKRWTRYQLVSRVGCGNLKAVGILRRILQEMEVRSMKDLSKIAPQDLAAIKGVGTTTLYAAMCLLDSEGVDIREWYGEERTFPTLKHRAAKQHEAEAVGNGDGDRAVSGSESTVDPASAVAADAPVQQDRWPDLDRPRKSRSHVRRGARRR